MSEVEQKPPRTFEAIQTEFNNLAFRAGQLSYQLDATTKDLNALYSTMRDLNFEAVAVKNKEAEAAKAAAEAAPAEQTNILKES